MGPLCGSRRGFAGAVTVKLVDTPGANMRVTGYIPDDDTSAAAVQSANNQVSERGQLCS